jgi:hypothetical protein
MCRVCKMPLDNEKAVLEAIEKKIKAGANPEHFTPLLDKLLGTEMTERDTEIEEEWEKRNRKGDGRS